MNKLINYTTFINENISLARAILNRNNIKEGTDEFNDYLKIRELCGTSFGYVGILTRLRVEDGITDMQDIESILDILKASKIDLARLNRMSYDDILDLFYDELNPESKKNKDFEVVFKDYRFTYYRVFTYEGIMKLSSPAWCLKTKSAWDKYQKTYPIQYIVIDNEWVNKLVTPNTHITKEYKSTKPDVRYGISLTDDILRYSAFDDNNTDLATLFNSNSNQRTNSIITNVLFSIKVYHTFNIVATPTLTDFKLVNDRFQGIGLKDNMKIWENRSYETFPLQIVFSEKEFYAVVPIKNPSYFAIVTKDHKLTLHNVSNSKDLIYSFFRLKLKKITLDELMSREDFFGNIDNWLIFNQFDKFLVVNCNTNLDEVDIPLFKTDNLGLSDQGEPFYKTENPLYFWLDPTTLYPTTNLDEIAITTKNIKDKKFQNFGNTYTLVRNYLSEKLGMPKLKQQRSSILPGFLRNRKK